jgi:hypothetical protein
VDRRVKYGFLFVCLFLSFFSSLSFRLLEVMGRPEVPQGAVSSDLFNAAAFQLAQLAVQPSIIEERMLEAKAGAHKQTYAETLVGVWKCCADDKVAMVGACESVLMELKKTQDTPSETLRGNGLGSKISSLYLQEVGRRWLQRVILPLHKEMEKDAKVNFCEYFLDTLIREAPHLPRTLKYICHTIDTETKNKPAEGIALRSFLILRFIVPSLMIPKQLDAIVSPETQKKLLVVSKKVQLLANKKLESELELNRQLEQFLSAAKSGNGTDLISFVFFCFLCFRFA